MSSGSYNNSNNSTNRRLSSRSTRSYFPSTTTTTGHQQDDYEQQQQQTGGVNYDEQHSYAPLPKHIPFPDVPHNIEFVSEFSIFFFTLIAAGAQFMHLYRTVWWLPDSYTNHTMVR